MDDKASIIQTLYSECEGYLELRALGKVKKQAFLKLGDTRGISAFIRTHRDADLYFAVSTRDGTSGKKESIVHIPALWCDIDFKEIEQAEAEKKLESFPFQPTIRVLSGGGLHLYWKLREPSGQDDIPRVEAILRWIAITLGGDLAATDASRILRIPHTKNHKYKPPRTVLLQHCNGTTFNLSDFEELLPPDTSKPKNQALPFSLKMDDGLKAIMQCKFMQHCQADATTLPENEWFLMVRQLAKEPGGIALIHQLSKPYPGYSRAETDAKILHTLNDTAGPCSCETIKSVYSCGMLCEVKAPAALRFVEQNQRGEQMEQMEQMEQREQREHREQGEQKRAEGEHLGSIEGADFKNTSPNGNFTNEINEVSRGSIEGAESQECQFIEQNQLGEHLAENGYFSGEQNGQDEKIAQYSPLSERGLTCQIREWIKNTTGSFTTRDIDNEFALRTRSEKNARARALYKYIKEELILKDRAIQGKYHVIDKNISWIDLDADTEPCYPVKLPLNISNMVQIPPKSIVIVAGATNSGKTAFLLNAAAQNLAGQKQQVYLMSEMGHSEYLTRLARFNPEVRFDAWKALRAAERSCGFNSVIWNYNRDGITYVDFLEDIGGEYFKLASGIREIYDALGEGIAIVALQKKKAQDYGRGGEATAEKARLYVAIDVLCQCRTFSICSCKIVKAKDYSGEENPNGKECHFRLYSGTHFKPIASDSFQWRWVSDKERQGLVARYLAQYGERGA